VSGIWRDSWNLSYRVAINRGTRYSLTMTDKGQFNTEHNRVSEQLRHLSEHLPATLIMSVLVAVLFVVALWSIADHYLMLGWFVVLLVTVGFRLLVILPLILGDAKTVDFTRKRRWLFLVASAVSGAVWGSAAVLFFDSGNPLGYAVITMVIAGVAAGAIASYSSWMPAYISFSVPMVLPLAACFLWDDGYTLNIIGIMILLYLVLCILASLNYQKLFYRAIDLQFINQDLVRELTETNEKLHEYSYTDPLTEIPNRRFFDDNLWQSLERARTNAKSVSLLIIDVDHFKEYNDAYGHDEGDLVLQSIATNLRSLCTGSNMEVARIGGEEFAVVMFDTDCLQAQTMAEDIRKHIEQMYSDEQSFGFREQISVSVGVATSTESNRLDARELFRKADTGLYQAKEHGRNQVVMIGAEAVQ